MLEKIENKIIKKTTGSELEDVDVELTDEEKFGVKKRQFRDLGFALAVIFGSILGLFIGLLSSDFLYQYIDMSIGFLNPPIIPLFLAFLVLGIGSLISTILSEKYSQMIDKWKDRNKEMYEKFNPLTGKSEYKVDLVMEKLKSKIKRGVIRLILSIFGLSISIFWLAYNLYTYNFYSDNIILIIFFTNIFALIAFSSFVFGSIKSIRENKSKRQQAIEKIKEDEEDELIC